MKRQPYLIVLAFLSPAFGAQAQTATPATSSAPGPASAGPAAARAPVAAELEAKNLRVLPREWTRRQVVDQVMKTWTADLGVRCQHCHVGEESQPFSEWDFASDEKPTKQRAREMLQMLEEINRRLGAMDSLHGTAAVQATCYTCHRGMPRPRRIEDIFEETRAASGLESAITQYRELRTQSLAAGGYDFSVKPLIRMARARLSGGDPGGARKLLDVALGLGFDVLATRSVLADVALAEGDRAAAVEHLRKALALVQNPAEKEFVEEQLKRVAAAEPER